MGMNRRRLLAAGGAITVAAAGAAVALRHEPRQPELKLPKAQAGALNILLVVTDQERAWDLLPAGFIETHCPGRSRLLREAVNFTLMHAPSEFCSMARGIIYTGQHPQRNGLWENIPLPYATNLHRDVPTLGTMFGAAGYHTAYFGKWHLSRLNDKSGRPFSPEQVQSELQAYGFTEIGTTQELDGPECGFEYDRLTAARFITFLRGQRHGAQPWFAAVNIVNPHDIMYYTAGDAMTRSRVTNFPNPLARPPADPLYTQDLGYPLLPNYGPATIEGRPAAVLEYERTMELALGYLPYDDARIAHEYQNYYFNCIRDSDRHLQAVLNSLDETGQADRTLVVLVGDHGELLGTHGLRGKGCVSYREGSRVPLLIRHPGGAKGKRCDALVSQLDLVPTLLSAAGVPAQAVAEALPQLHGKDLTACVANPVSADPRPAGTSDGVLLHWTSLAFQDHDAILTILRERSEGHMSLLTFPFKKVRTAMHRRGQMRSVYDGRYKFARYFMPTDHHVPADWSTLVQRNDLELYDTLTDPGELHNLALDLEASREQLLRMNAKLNRLIAREIGVDDGSFLPGPDWLWRGA